MKKDIHPAYVDTEVTCTCGNDVHHPQHRHERQDPRRRVLGQCHPFYTGKQKILDTGGRVARFEERYGKKAAAR